jgi:hypothetical protein
MLHLRFSNETHIALRYSNKYVEVEEYEKKKQKQKQ